MHTKRIPSLLIVIAISIVSYRSQCQAILPVCLVHGVEGGGPVIIASITAADLISTKSPMEFTPTVALHIEEYLRGPRFESDAVKLPIDWTLGPSQPYAKRRPVWYDVVPSVGTRVLLTLFSDRGGLHATCAVGSESIAEATPFVKSMISLRSLPEKEKVTAMEKALKDPSFAVRELAVDYLTSPKASNPQARLAVLQHFAPIAQDTKSAQRGEAINSIRAAYDGFSMNSDTNYKILSLMADLMADPDQETRSTAVQFIHSKLLGGGRNTPDFSRIEFRDKGKVLKQLTRDVQAGQPDARESKRILDVLNGK